MWIKSVITELEKNFHLLFYNCFDYYVLFCLLGSFCNRLRLSVPVPPVFKGWGSRMKLPEDLRFFKSGRFCFGYSFIKRSPLCLVSVLNDSLFSLIWPKGCKDCSFGFFVFVYFSAIPKTKDYCLTLFSFLWICC